MRVTLDSCRCQELLQNEHKLSSPSRNCDPPQKKWTTHIVISVIPLTKYTYLLYTI